MAGRTRWLAALIGSSLVWTTLAQADPIDTILAQQTAVATRPAGSTGCTAEVPPLPPAALEVDDERRPLIVALPPDYRPDRPHALVIAFHGRTSPSATVRRYYGLEEAAGEPTIFVYPSALKGADGGFIWSDPDDPPDRLRGFALFDAIIRTMDRLYCIDRRRIFAVGHSLGAWFANSLACARGDVLRAIGTVAGAVTPSSCRGNVAAILFHNPKDRLVPITLGRAARDLLASENGLPDGGSAVEFEGFACTRYGDGLDAPPVLWCPYSQSRTPSGRYYPHRWPAGAGAAIMRFFGSLDRPA